MAHVIFNASSINMAAGFFCSSERLVLSNGRPAPILIAPQECIIRGKSIKAHATAHGLILFTPKVKIVPATKLGFLYIRDYKNHYRK